MVIPSMLISLSSAGPHRRSRSRAHRSAHPPDHLRAGNQGTGDGHTLFLPAAHLVGKVFSPIRQTHLLQVSECFGLPFFPRNALVIQRKRDVFQGSFVTDQIEALKNKTQKVASVAGCGFSDRPSMFCPLSMYEPSSKSSNSPKTLSKVDLPEPLEPMMATNSFFNGAINAFEHSQRLTSGLISLPDGLQFYHVSKITRAQPLCSAPSDNSRENIQSRAASKWGCK